MGAVNRSKLCRHPRFLSGLKSPIRALGSEKGMAMLAGEIQRLWHECGHTNVKVMAVEKRVAITWMDRDQVRQSAEVNSLEIVSNLVDGLAPR